jgi:peptidoglycan/LPS O-acetylase OafA/YrhL
MYDEWLGFGRDLSAWENLLVYSTSVALTIAVSTLSYYFFEKPFMRRKTKLAMIVSGDDARH